MVDLRMGVHGRFTRAENDFEKYGNVAANEI